MKFPKTFEEIKEMGLKSAFSFYLASCYLYYVQDKSVLSDTDFDNLSKFLYENWEKIKHEHKNLVKKEFLLVSGYGIPFPLRVRCAGELWYSEIKKEENK